MSTKKKPQIFCPYCHVFSQMDVHDYYFDQDLIGNQFGPEIINQLEIRRCSNCGGKFFYENGHLLYPEPASITPEPAMPEDVKAIYIEASSIYHRSPRAACALLRLAIERLCDDLDAKGNNLDSKISNLVKRGLSEDVQRALDFVRVIGNNAVHPGKIEYDIDNEQTANMLFKLLNIIVQRLISQPATINALYEALPDGIRASVIQRDK